MLNFSLRPDHRGKDEATSMQYLHQTYPHLKQWTDSLQHASALCDTFIQNAEGKQLHAYYVRAARPTTHTAVIVHGYTDNAIRMLMIGYMFSHELGYNILLPNLQNHGQSEGEAIQMGWKDRLDVLDWMEVANELYSLKPDSTDTESTDTESIDPPTIATQMVVHGISMGAATTMMVSGEELPAYVKCFVEDCGYTSVWDEFSKELKVQFGLPEFPLMHIASLLCKQQYGWSFQEASALEQVKKCKLPMLFIHGDADDYVPTWMVHTLYEAKSQPKELWIVPQAEHATSYQMYPDEYTQKVKAFVSKYIN